MRLLAIIIATLSLLGLGLTTSGTSTSLPVYVALSGGGVAAILMTTRMVGPFLRFFIVFYGLSFALLLALILAQGILPAAISSFVPPPLTAFTAAAFVGFIFLMSRVPVIKDISAIADPYFSSSTRGDLAIHLLPKISSYERWIGMGLLAAIILINLGQVAISVRSATGDATGLMQSRPRTGLNSGDCSIRNGCHGWRCWSRPTCWNMCWKSTFKIRWRTWMTDSADLALALRWRALPDQPVGLGHRQSGSAHPGRRQRIHRHYLFTDDYPDPADIVADLVLSHPLGTF